MIVREMRKEDVDAAAEVYGEHIVEWEVETARHYFKLSLDEKKKMHHFKALDYWVAEEGGEVVGVIGLYNFVAWPERVAWLGYFAVKKTFQHKGIGSALYEKAEAVARERGVRIMCIFTSGDEEEGGSVEFYSGKGFQAAGRIPDFWGEGDDQIYLWKRLK